MISKIFQDKIELKMAYENIKKGKNGKKSEKSENINENEKINSGDSTEGIFLTNVNKKFQSKSNNSKNKLKPIGNILNAKIKIKINQNNISNKEMTRSSSLPKFGVFKSKLKPINIKTMKRNNDNKMLINSKSQRTIEKVKK